MKSTYICTCCYDNSGKTGVQSFVANTLGKTKESHCEHKLLLCINNWQPKTTKSPTYLDH